MATPNPSTPPPAGSELTVAHLTNTLGQIESWIGAVRVALGGLAPGMSLPHVEGLSPRHVSALRVKKECPPRKVKKTPKKKK
jgi:hypothetical protein